MTSARSASLSESQFLHQGNGEDNVRYPKCRCCCESSTLPRGDTSGPREHLGPPVSLLMRSALGGDPWVWRRAWPGVGLSLLLTSKVSGLIRSSPHPGLPGFRVPVMYLSIVLTSGTGERRDGGHRRGPRGWLPSWEGLSGTAISSSPPRPPPPLPPETVQSLSRLLWICLRNAGNWRFWTCLQKHSPPHPTPAEKFQAKAISQPGRKLPAWAEVGGQCGLTVSNTQGPLTLIPCPLGPIHLPSFPNLSLAPSR